MKKKIKKIIELLRKNTKDFDRPMSDVVVDEYGKDPYLILISCLLSLRAKDSMTIKVVRDLFARARTPKQLLALSLSELEHIIKRIGFYKVKARTLKRVTEELVRDYDGKVPQTYDELTAIKGIGLKTANLVLGVAFDKPAICVDVHVHRISNRLGIIATQTPEQTEQAIQKIVDKRYWTEWNPLLVMWGQNICTPRLPRCSMCALRPYCQQVGVKKHR